MGNFRIISSIIRILYEIVKIFIYFLHLAHKIRKFQFEIENKKAGGIKMQCNNSFIWFAPHSKALSPVFFLEYEETLPFLIYAKKIWLFVLFTTFFFAYSVWHRLNNFLSPHSKKRLIGFPINLFDSFIFSCNHDLFSNV